VLIGVPDSPVFKHQSTATVVELSRNLGMHFHAILTIPRKSRLKTWLKNTSGRMNQNISATMAS
jgi:hypothetical protein